MDSWSPGVGARAVGARAREPARGSSLEPRLPQASNATSPPITTVRTWLPPTWYGTWR
jgi:hypothetical protein